MIVHSYGAGVQSVTILYKAIRGEINRPDLVIFADTQAEPDSVYQTVERDRIACEDAGIEFCMVTAGNLESSKAWFIPAYTMNKNGNKGTTFRQCTDRFKIRPIRKELRLRKWQEIELWLGISTDEASRMKDSTVKNIAHSYPLIDLGMSRTDCEEYLRQINVTASKSACVFCPYRSKDSWDSLTGSEMERAIRYDERLRNRHKGVMMYIHSSRRPLKDAIYDQDNGNLNLFENECEGHCGL